MACDEAELSPEEFATKMEAFHKAQQQQNEMMEMTVWGLSSLCCRLYCISGA